jgi:hypothetical protein
VRAEVISLLFMFLPRSLRQEIGAMKRFNFFRMTFKVAAFGLMLVACRAQGAPVITPPPATPPPVTPSTSPQAAGTVGGTPVPITPSGGKVVQANGAGGTVPPPVGSAGMVITSSGNTDPNQLFDITAANLTTDTVSFSYYFTIPIFPDPVATDTIRADLTVTPLLANTGNISDHGTDPFFSTWLGLVGDRGSWTDQNVDQNNATGFHSTGPIPVTLPVPSSFLTIRPLTGPNDNLGLFVQFDLSPGGQFDLVGHNFLEHVPEPGSLICWTGMGLAFFGAYTWRRRRRIPA